jgi:hypothetical protein
MMPDYDPIYLTLNEKPRAILRGMTDLVAKQEQIEEDRHRRRWIPLLLFLAGIPFILVDVLFTMAGYSMCVFSLVAAACWIAALVSFIVLRRARAMQFPPLYDTTREIIHTLRDDVNPKRTFFGHLDLTGSQLPDKLARESSDAVNRVTQHYRDEWLSLKAKLYDGNMLRLSAVKQVKNRKGYWKRGTISGKRKWKPDKYKGSRQVLKVRLSVNPQVYLIPDSSSFALGAGIGPYTITHFNASGGIIDFAGRYSGETASAGDILGVLRAIYDLLERKALV